MATEQQLRSTVEICLSILTRYRNGQRSQGTRERMAAEIAAVVGCLEDLDLADGEAEDHVLRPVEAHLVARYGHEAGRRLNAEFVDAFEAVGMHLLVRRPARRGRELMRLPSPIAPGVPEARGLGHA